jgi:hypothetical protein
MIDIGLVERQVSRPVIVIVAIAAVLIQKRALRAGCHASLLSYGG